MGREAIVRERVGRGERRKEDSVSMMRVSHTRRCGAEVAEGNRRARCATRGRADTRSSARAGCRGRDERWDRVEEACCTWPDRKVLVEAGEPMWPPSTSMPDSRSWGVVMRRVLEWLTWRPMLAMREARETVSAGADREAGTWMRMSSK
jgi:hypothetical protein